MLDVIAELKGLRLRGMADCWAEVGEQDRAALESSRWLIVNDRRIGAKSGSA